MSATSVPIPALETKGKPKGSLSSRRDLLLKRLFEAFFGDLIRLVAPELEAPLNLDRVRLRQRHSPIDRPSRSRRAVELLAEVERRNGRPALLVDVEIQALAQRSMSDRLWWSHLELGLSEGLQVVSILVNLKGGPAGVTWQTYAEGVDDEVIASFRHRCFGISGCLAEEYLAKPVPLAWGLAALMPSQKWNRGEQKIECLRRISAAPNLDEMQTALLVECVETCMVE